jgi:hypothetical protein
MKNEILLTKRCAFEYETFSLNLYVKLSKFDQIEIRDTSECCRIKMKFYVRHLCRGDEHTKNAVNLWRALGGLTCDKTTSAPGLDEIQIHDRIPRAFCFMASARSNDSYSAPSITDD